VNITSRLCSLCSGADLVLSSAACNDPEIAAYLASPEAPLGAAPECATLKGFGDLTFEVWRLRRS
jgi:class 3 adenylate cyclase